MSNKVEYKNIWLMFIDVNTRGKIANTLSRLIQDDHIHIDWRSVFNAKSGGCRCDGCGEAGTLYQTCLPDGRLSEDSHCAICMYEQQLTTKEQEFELGGEG